MDRELVNKIEAMLFATGRDIQLDEFSIVLEKETEEIEKAIDVLRQRYIDRGIDLVKVGNGYQLVSAVKYYEDVCKLYEETKSKGITPVCMEVLSIIAYNPKITKGQVEKIRGVNSDAAVNKLLEFGMIEDCGKMNTPGRPTMYKTTKEFLINFGLSSEQDLPDYELLKVEDEQLEIKEVTEE